MPILTEDQVAQIAVQYFSDLGDPNLPVIMTAIAFGESSFNTDAQGGGAKGLWQIQQSAHSEFGADFYNTLWKVPANNALAAREIYTGKNGGPKGLGNWSAYNGSQYMQNLPAAQASVNKVKAAGGGALPSVQGQSVLDKNLAIGGAAAGIAAGALGAPLNPGISVDANGNVTNTTSVANPFALFGGLGPALWIGGGAVLVVLGIVMLNKGTIIQAAKVAAV